MVIVEELSARKLICVCVCVCVFVCVCVCVRARACGVVGFQVEIYAIEM